MQSQKSAQARADWGTLLFRSVVITMLALVSLQLVGVSEMSLPLPQGEARAIKDLIGLHVAELAHELKKVTDERDTLARSLDHANAELHAMTPSVKILEAELKHSQRQLTASQGELEMASTSLQRYKHLQDKQRAVANATESEAVVKLQKLQKQIFRCEFLEAENKKLAAEAKHVAEATAQARSLQQEIVKLQRQAVTHQEVNARAEALVHEYQVATYLLNTLSSKDYVFTVMAPTLLPAHEITPQFAIVWAQTLRNIEQRHMPMLEAAGTNLTADEVTTTTQLWRPYSVLSFLKSDDSATTSRKIGTWLDESWRSAAYAFSNLASNYTCTDDTEYCSSLFNLAEHLLDTYGVSELAGVLDNGRTSDEMAAATFVDALVDRFGSRRSLFTAGVIEHVAVHLLSHTSAVKRIWAARVLHRASGTFLHQQDVVIRVMAVAAQELASRVARISSASSEDERDALLLALGSTLSIPPLPKEAYTAVNGDVLATWIRVADPSIPEKVAQSIRNGFMKVSLKIRGHMEDTASELGLDFNNVYSALSVLGDDGGDAGQAMLHRLRKQMIVSKA